MVYEWLDSVKLIPSILYIKYYIFIENNFLTEDDTLVISKIVNCNEDNMSKKETNQHDEAM